MPTITTQRILLGNLVMPPPTDSRVRSGSISAGRLR
jgi:hypothetical protein